jgi:myo-inositol-1(or 4)-monophosphatase
VLSTDAPLDLARLGPRIADIVAEAGAIAERLFHRGAQLWIKSDDSPVTEADLAVDRYLFERLPQLVADSAWLSEETADTPERLARRRVWVVDPIDGTRAFVQGRPEWVVSVALVEDGAPIAGVVHNPCTHATYAAVRDGGAFLNGQSLAAPDSESLSGLCVSGPPTLLAPLEASGVLKGPWTYALANRLVKVADGGLGAALARATAQDWDIAAAHQILEEAGARLTGLDGAVPSYNRPTTRHGGLVAAGPQRHAALLAALAAETETLPTPEPHR